MVLLAERLVKLQQQQPVHFAAVGGAVEVLQQAISVDAADLQLALGLARAARIWAHSSAPDSSTIAIREKSMRTAVGLAAAEMPSRRMAAAFLSSRPGSSRLSVWACWGLGCIVAAQFLPDRRRGFKAHRVVQRHLFEFLFAVLHAIEVEQHVPGAAVARRSACPFSIRSAMSAWPLA
jgi:hypothetical protein